MSLNTVQKQPSKYEVVKILGIESDPLNNQIRVMKLVKLKKPSRVTMPAFINLDDDEIIEIDDNDKENANRENFGNLIQNNTTNGSNLIISAVTSGCQPARKSVPTVISITTDETNNKNIHEEIEKVKRSLTENSSSYENLGQSQTQFQPKSLSSRSESQELLVELQLSKQSVQMEVDPQTTNLALKEQEQVNQNRPKRARKVPQKLLGVEKYQPLKIKLRLSDTQDAAKSSNKRKSYEIVGPEKLQKIPRRSEKLPANLKEMKQDEKASNSSEFGIKFTQDGLLLRSSPVRAVQVQKSCQQPEDKVYQIPQNFENLVQIPTKETEGSPKSANLKKLQQILENPKPDTNQNQPIIQPKSTIKLEERIQVDDSKWMTLSEIGPIYLTSTRNPHEIFKGLDASKAKICRGGIKLRKIDASKYEMVKESNLKPKLEKSPSSPSENPAFQNLISILNLQPTLSNSKNQKSKPKVQSTETRPNVAGSLSPKEPGSYLMNLKCHKTCSSGKAHKKKHQVDISSPMGQLLTRRDVVGESSIQESLKRIEELTKTPIYESKTGSFVCSKANAKQDRKLKPKVGRKPEENKVLAQMRESGLERNFMRKGRGIAPRTELINVKEEFMLTEIREEEV